MPSRSVKSVAWLVFFAVTASVLWYSTQHYKAKVESRRQLAQAKTDAQRSRVVALATKHNADIGWPHVLAGNGSIRVSALQSMELQNVWLAGKPILFIARTDDIAKSTTERGGYVVRLTYDGYAHNATFLGTKLQLLLTCSHESLYAALAQIMKPDRFSLGANVAVVAAIDSVNEAPSVIKDESTEKVLQGTGRCLEAASLPDEGLFSLHK